jgi:glycosyltransferase involved in cell wall biosynthesis
MKLIYLSHWRFPSEKTMTPLILKTCAHFVRRGWEVELWIPRRDNDYKPDEDVFELYKITPRFVIRRIPCIDTMRFLGVFGFLLMVATFNLSAYMKLRRERAAVVYAHDIRDILLPVFCGLPVFTEIHDFYVSSLDVVNRTVFARAAGLIVTNALKIARISERYGFPKERMLRQPNAVEAKDFDISTSQEEARATLGLPLSGKIALYTGHLFGWKGVHTLADAAASLPADVSVLFVGGTPEDRAALQTYIKERNLPRISFVPHQTPDKIPLYQKAADVLVLPNTAKEEASRVETSPVKLFEYLASGKPIVVSDIPSIRDIVSEKEVFFATPDDGESFARVIALALKGDSKKTEAARAFAWAHSWESRAERIDIFMKRCIEMRYGNT